MNARVSALTLLGPIVALTAHAEVYLNETQAAAAIFPGRQFSRQSLDLNDNEASEIEKHSGEHVRSRHLVFLKAETKDIVVIDEVLGKHEFISYAVGISPNGKVQGIEVLSYQESYGRAVRGSEWRHQFVGKDIGSHLKLDDDIKNISGATLSSKHLTDGVRRILKTYDIIRHRL